MARIKAREVDLGVTVAEALEEFVTEKEALGRAPRTIDNYKDSVAKMLKALELSEDTPIAEIRQDTLFKYIARMRESGLHTDSINHYLRDWRSFLYWCMSKDYLPQYKIELVKGQELPPKTFTQEEYTKLIRKPDKKAGFVEWRNYMTSMWVLATGDRVSTLVDIKIEDLDFKSKQYTVRHTKNKKPQVKPMSKKLMAAVREYLKKWELPADGYLFPTQDGYQQKPDGIKHSFRKHCLARGVDKTSLHGLRHTFGTEWVANGGDSLLLKKMMGHSSVAMTNRYVELSTEQLKAPVDMFSPLDNIGKRR